MAFFMGQNFIVFAICKGTRFFSLIFRYSSLHGDESFCSLFCQRTNNNFLQNFREAQIGMSVSRSTPIIVHSRLRCFNLTAHFYGLETKKSDGPVCLRAQQVQTPHPFLSLDFDSFTHGASRWFRLTLFIVSYKKYYPVVTEKQNKTKKLCCDSKPRNLKS